MHDLVIIHEHPEWHEPLFQSLTNRGVDFGKIDLKKGCYAEDDLPEARLYYNMVSPSAYKRGNQRAIPLAFSLCRHLEMQGAAVLNGSGSMIYEMSKSAQIALLKKLNISHPKSIVFNHLDGLRPRINEIIFPVILKPEQGGSGARMYLANSWNELEEILNSDEEIWWPDNLLLIQEKIDYDTEHGIVRLEYVDDEFLYAMRVVTHDSFNLCPSLVCNPLEGEGVCEVPSSKKPEFYPLEDVDVGIINDGKRIMRSAGHYSGSVEYCLDKSNQPVIYDVNANSNLRAPIAEHFGIEPFERVVDSLLLTLSTK